MAAARSKLEMGLQRLNAEADKAAALARAAKQRVRAAKAALKRARKLAKQLKKAAKQARKKAEVAGLSAVTTPIAGKAPKAPKAPKVLRTPKVPKAPKVLSRPVKRAANPKPSAAAVAQSVIQHLDEQAQVPPKPSLFTGSGS
jgi:hypothetical protein